MVTKAVRPVVGRTSRWPLGGGSGPTDVGAFRLSSTWRPTALSVNRRLLCSCMSRFSIGLELDCPRALPFSIRRKVAAVHGVHTGFRSSQPSRQVSTPLFQVGPGARGAEHATSSRPSVFRPSARSRRHVPPSAQDPMVIVLSVCPAVFVRRCAPWRRSGRCGCFVLPPSSAASEHLQESLAELVFASKFGPSWTVSGRQCKYRRRPLAPLTSSGAAISTAPSHPTRHSCGWNSHRRSHDRRPQTSHHVAPDRRRDRVLPSKNPGAAARPIAETMRAWDNESWSSRRSMPNPHNIHTKG